ncbi:MAG: relaxase/mobilization nuclease domain-containing protein [Oscillospiraceae bacterium]|nr:relaxase/mobilization nuclease domain-containing protein [Oscillospiraceae bacterium]
MAVIKAVHSKAKLSVAVDYITKKEKTEERLISGIHCDPMSATMEMETTKRVWHKTGGRQYDHYIQSFSPYESVTPAQAHEIAVRWASGEFYGYECLVSTHVDRDHVHSHIIVNSVNYQTGKKIHTSAYWLQEAKEFSDNLCLEAGLTICEKGKTFDGQQRTDATTWNKDKHQVLEKAARGEGHSFLLEIAVAVCSVLKSALSREDFIEKLLDYGVATTWTDTKKYITFSDLEGHKVRNKKLSDTFHFDFSKESLQREFTKHRREQAQRESQAAAATHRGVSERVQGLDVPRHHDADRPAGQAPLTDKAAGEQPRRLEDIIRQAKSGIIRGNDPSAREIEPDSEGFFSFDVLLGDSIRRADEHNAARTQNHTKKHRGMEL